MRVAESSPPVEAPAADPSPSEPAPADTPPAEAKSAVKPEAPVEAHAPDPPPSEEAPAAGTVVAEATAPPTIPPPPPPKFELGLPPAPPPTVDAVARLAGRSAAATVHTATDALFAAWHVRSLDAHDPALPAGFTEAAHERALEYLPLIGNLSMLRVLDLPAVLELRIPGTDEPRYAALVGVSASGALLRIDGETVPVDTAFLDQHWSGTAHVLWRDFESLGRAFGREGSGAPVARLQALLRKVGTYHGRVNGVFDGATEAAVVQFQRSRLLVPDGRIGRLTRIVLYAAKGGYTRPTLGAAS